MWPSNPQAIDQLKPTETRRQAQQDGGGDEHGGECGERPERVEENDMRDWDDQEQNRKFAPEPSRAAQPI